MTTASLTPIASADLADDLFVAIYDRVYGQIDYLVRNKSLDLSNVDELIKVTMETIDFISSEGKYLSGTQKGEIAKQVVIAIIKDLIKKKKIDSALGNNILLAVDFLGPAIFKLVALASKGMINLIHGSATPEVGPSGVAKAKCCSVL